MQHSNAPIDILDENFQEIQPAPGATTRVKTKPIPKKTTPQARPRKLLTAEQLLEHETALIAKGYNHINPGTLLNATKGEPTNGLSIAETIKYKHKRSVLIQCVRIECTNTRRIATSDLAQVQLCEECTKDARNTRKRSRRALARALKDDNEPAAHAAIQAIRQNRPRPAPPRTP